MEENKTVVTNENFDWNAFENDLGVYSQPKEEIAAAYDKTLSNVAVGEVVEGTVTAITKREVMVNIGYKSGGEAVLKLMESGMVHTVTLKQVKSTKKNKKIAAAAYLYQADNDGEWGEIRFDFENGTAEIVKMADWDTVKSYVFAKAAIRFVQSLPETRLLKSTVVPFEMERPDLI